MRPIVNKLRCKKCNDIIESRENHDMIYCQCGAIYVDGGHEYQRYGWSGGDVDDVIDFSFSRYERTEKEQS